MVVVLLQISLVALSAADQMLYYRFGQKREALAAIMNVSLMINLQESAATIAAENYGTN